jgi:hypothetical protein
LGGEGLLDRPVMSEAAAVDESEGKGGCLQAVADQQSAHTGARAKQTVAPATRWTVLRRDRRRCTLSCCKRAVFVDFHPIELRSESEGGRNNIVTLCSVHHRAAHHGQLRVTGSVSAWVRFQHSDGSE